MASYNCVHCSKTVSQRMHAVCCDACSRWMHRKCNTGISAEQYRLMTRGELELPWTCQECNQRDDTAPEAEEIGISTTTSIPLEPQESTSPIRGLNTTFIVRPADAEIDMETNAVKDVTFDLSDKDIQQPHVPLDESLADRPVDEEIQADSPVTFEVVEGRSK